MSESAVVIASPDEPLCRELADGLQDRCTLSVTTHLESVLNLLPEERPALLLADLRSLPDGGHAADRILEKVLLVRPRTRIILLAGGDCPELLHRRAACSGLEIDRGPHDAAHLAGTIGAFLPETEIGPPPVATRRTPIDAGGETFGQVVFEGVTRRFETRSPELKRMLEDLMIAASHDVTILLIGETGSGKTFLSKLVHETSPRRDEPFLHVACGALPRELIESELFGHAKGSFTSAHMDKQGKFVAAGRGTVLLDEIDVLGPEQQVKLLRVIETGEFEPVGSNQTLRSQARLVVASNLDLEPLVEQGRFRPDVYYRLNMLKFEIPPLRRRKVDIIPMAKRFIAGFQVRHGIEIHRIEDAVLDSLLNYPWPGNVRELEHVIQRAVIYCRDGVLKPEHLPGHILSGQAGPTNDPSVKLGRKMPAEETSLNRQVAFTEKEIIEQALFKNSFSRTRTAKDLGISRVTLYNKMKKYEMLK